jgi:cellulose synthase (UDP-forming)
MAITSTRSFAWTSTPVTFMASAWSAALLVSFSLPVAAALPHAGSATAFRSAAVLELHTWTPLLLAVGALLVVFSYTDAPTGFARALASALCILLLLRYLYWRIFFSLPLHQNWLQMLWARFFLGVEICSIASAILVYFFMSRKLDRRALADTRQCSPLNGAPVDVFIATYNEEQSILERTIVGAKAIQHSDLRIWVLDDGARPWIQQLAAELGVMYLSRVEGKHAKAGNVNNGLQHALSTGRPPQFLLLLDADFVPYRNILRRTLGLFEDPEVGVVQTPQHFFNRDPVQVNLLSSAVWPDEQRFFFNVLMPCKDAWGVAFCCGTSAVLRVAALQACGGMATETVTEDMLTTLRMEEYGFRTIYLNERLSMGLAPESLGEFISQRSRWCLGAIQQIFTRWSFFGPARIRFISRVAFFDSVLYWVSSAWFKLTLLAAPIVFWFTGTSVVRATPADLLYWLAPVVAANFLFVLNLSEKHVLPVLTDVTQFLTMFAVAGTVVTGLLHPFGRAFKVTSKGISSSRITVQWSILARFGGIAFLTILGMIINSFSFSPYHGHPGYSLTVFWSLANAFMLCLACIVCVEPPKRRVDERFSTTEPAAVVLQDGSELPCRLQDLSLGGACLIREDGWRKLVGPAALVLDYGRITVPFDVVRREGKRLALKFQPEPVLRRQLIVHLFTGTYHQDVESVSVPEVVRALARVVVS